MAKKAKETIENDVQETVEDNVQEIIKNDVQEIIEPKVETPKVEVKPKKENVGRDLTATQRRNMSHQAVSEFYKNRK